MTYSDVIRNAFYRILMYFTWRGNAYSQYHFQKSSFFSAEFKFAFFRVYTRYSVIDSCFCCLLDLKIND